jgi:hypothetical protein
VLERHTRLDAGVHDAMRCLTRACHLCSSVRCRPPGAGDGLGGDNELSQVRPSGQRVARRRRESAWCWPATDDNAARCHLGIAQPDRDSQTPLRPTTRPPGPYPACGAPAHHAVLAAPTSSHALRSVARPSSRAARTPAYSRAPPARLASLTRLDPRTTQARARRRRPGPRRQVSPARRRMCAGPDPYAAWGRTTSTCAGLFRRPRLRPGRPAPSAG